MSRIHVCLCFCRNNKMTFSINIANTKARTQLYHAEIDAVFNQIQEEIKRIGIGKALVG